MYRAGHSSWGKTQSCKKLKNNNLFFWDIWHNFLWILSGNRGTYYLPSLHTNLLFINLTLCYGIILIHFRQKYITNCHGYKIHIRAFPGSHIILDKSRLCDTDYRDFAIPGSIKYSMWDFDYRRTFFGPIHRKNWGPPVGITP